jgi:hypothetical protein
LKPRITSASLAAKAAGAVNNKVQAVAADIHFKDKIGYLMVGGRSGI